MNLVTDTAYSPDTIEKWNQKVACAIDVAKVHLIPFLENDEIMKNIFKTEQEASQYKKDNQLFVMEVQPIKGTGKWGLVFPLESHLTVYDSAGCLVKESSVRPHASDPEPPITANTKENTVMPDHVIRYVVTHIGKDGLRTLCGPAQGRITKETAEEAQLLLDNMMLNNRMEGDRLAGVYGLPLEVRPVKCYPGHFDPMSVYFDADDSTQSDQESLRPNLTQKQPSDAELSGLWSHSDTAGGSTDCEVSYPQMRG